MTKSSSRSKDVAIVALALALAGCVADPGTTTAPVAPAPQREATAPEPVPAAPAEMAVPHPIRVNLSWSEEKKDVIRFVGKRAITDDADLEAALREEKTAHEHDSEPPYVVLDVPGKVPWKYAIAVLSACKHVGIDRIEYPSAREH